MQGAAGFLYGVWLGMIFIWGMLSLPWDAIAHRHLKWPDD